METKSKLKVRQSDRGPLYVFWCPGCRETHSFLVAEGEWRFNGDFDKPSFFPSLKYDRCHLVMRDGVIKFLLDSDHWLAGAYVPLKEY